MIDEILWEDERVIRTCRECPLSVAIGSLSGVVNLYCRLALGGKPGVHYTGPDRAFALIVDPESKPPFCPLPISLSR